VIVTVPGPATVSVLPATVATKEEELVKETVRPDDAEAERLIDPAELSTVDGDKLKVIVCVAFAIVNPLAAELAPSWLLSPATVAVTV
jgi:hypothetical protein